MTGRVALIGVIALAGVGQVLGLQQTQPKRPEEAHRPAHSHATPPAPPPPAPKTSEPCTADQYRQFDFWIGDWEVHNPDGDIVGENRIEPILDGCVLLENWKGRGGSVGSSFNIFDPRDGNWHQFWVDNRGTRLQLTGGLKNGGMVLTGTTISPQDPGKLLLNRITWTPLDGGRVHQVWDRSQDSGQTWNVIFDGTYVKKDKAD